MRRFTLCIIFKSNVLFGISMPHFTPHSAMIMNLTGAERKMLMTTVSYDFSRTAGGIKVMGASY